MLKIARIITLLLSSLMMTCFLAACGGSFFETPSQEQTTPTENTDVTLKEEANLNDGDNAQTAVTDETWNVLAISYADLEKDYQALKTAYEAEPLKANSDVDALLVQANDLISTMGETKRSQISENDALDLQQVIVTMNESVNELYDSIIHEETLSDEDEIDANEEETTEPEDTER